MCWGVCKWLNSASPPGATSFQRGRTAAPRSATRSPGRFAQVGGAVLRRQRVDEEAAPPFEARDLGQLGDDLEVPVEVREPRVAEGRGVQHEVVRGLVEQAVHAPQGLAERARGWLQLLVDA